MVKELEIGMVEELETGDQNNEYRSQKLAETKK